MKTNWDISHLYKNHDEWQKDYNLLEKNIDKLENDVNTFLDTLKSYHDFVVSKIECDEMVEKLYCYCARHTDLDNTLENYNEDKNKALELFSRLEKIKGIFESAIINNEDKVNSYMNNKEFEEYKRYIYLILREKKHIVTDKKNIDLKVEASKEIQDIKSEYRNVTNDMRFDSVNIDGEEVEVNKANYSKLITNSKSENRKKIYESYIKGYIKIKDQIIDLYNKKRNNNNKIAELEEYNNTLEKEVFKLELDESIITELIKEINNNLDILHSYNEYKKEVSGLEDFHVYDLNAPMDDAPSRDYTFDESIDMVKEALKVLGEDYINIMDKMLNEGWIDVYPKEGKRSMSYTCISYVGVPYVLINYNGTLTSTRTLAHEIGHSVNTYLSNINNKFEYYEFSMFLTEIASKVNEILFNEYIINKTDNEEEKKFILNNIISGLINSVFNQTLLTEFEYRYNENPDELYMELYKKYNGDAINYDDYIKYNYLTVPHFVMQDDYYLYKYSIGTMLAFNIAYRILDKEPNIVGKYKEFLSVGRSISIKEALEIIDIDLSKKEYIEDGMKIIRKKINELGEQ